MGLASMSDAMSGIKESHDIVDTLGGIDVYSELAFTTSEDSEHVMMIQSFQR